MNQKIKVLRLYKKYMKLPLLFGDKAPDSSRKLPDNVRVAFKLHKSLKDQTEIDNKYNKGLQIYNVLYGLTQSDTELLSLLSRKQRR